MKSIGIFAVLAVIGIGLGVIFFVRSSQSPQTEDVSEKQSLSSDGKPASQMQAPEDTYIPPTLPPLSRTVAEVTEVKIVVRGPEGDMTLPKDPAIVTVKKNMHDGTFSPASFADVHVGQSVTVHIIRPGEEAEIILE